MPSMSAFYMQGYRERKRALGLCYDCKEQAMPGKTRCAYHAGVNRRDARARIGLLKPDELGFRGIPPVRELLARRGHTRLGERRASD